VPTERLKLHAFAALAAACVLAAGAQEMHSRPQREVAAPAFALRAPGSEAVRVSALPQAKQAPSPEVRGKRVGSVRDVAGSSAAASWREVEGGWVARFVAASPGAAGLRTRLALPAGIDAAEVVARGSAGATEGFAVAGPQAWTPWTEGDAQEIEIYSRTLPAGGAALEAIVHFDVAPTAKAAAGSCSPDVACSSGDAVRDAAIAERRNSVALISFVDGTQALVCTATLLNTEKFPTPYLVTANHCIATAAAAASATTLWFNEATTCGGTSVNPGLRQVAGGAQLVFTSYGADSTLLLMNRNPPAGAVFSGWNAAPLADKDPVVSISHPQGDVKKFAIGQESGELLVQGYPQDLYGVTFTRGVTEGGSSGSGLFMLSGTSLQLRGVLSGSTLRSGAALSCSNADVEDALYGRFEIFQPQIAGYIAASPPVRTDDYGNRITEAQRIFVTPSATVSETPFPGRIDYPGDVDVFRIDVPQAGGTLTVRTESSIDTIGTLLDSTGKAIKSVNDAETKSLDFGITRTLATGTYYVAVSHQDAQGTGPYTFKASLSTVTDNYTDLWWNPSESGWGININHQGTTLFATLFTYDRDGTPMWLVMPSSARQPDGSWQGTLYRTTGPAFNATPWGAIQSTAVGTMRIAFASANSGTLSYSVNGTSVNKTIQRQVFSVPPVCKWSAFDRSYTTNFQDLWWNPSESGWGINIAHQGSILFATVFTYSGNGQGLWLVMSRGERIGDGLYIGDLYTVRGPPFNASPWTAATPTVVGTMTIQFTRGNAGTLTYTLNGVLVVKQIQRQVFGAPTTECFAPGDE
jgi:hypothetical protein